jgi:hypothetical protein
MPPLVPGVKEVYPLIFLKPNVATGVELVSVAAVVAPSILRRLVAVVIVTSPVPPAVREISPDKA